MEFLFMGKKWDNSVWVYGNLIQSKSGDAYILPIEEEDLTENIMVIPESVGQYTGLKDKNGNKIYGGHILKTPAAMLRGVFNYSYVEYNPEIASFIKRSKDNKGFTRLEIRINEVEIIGNMTDSPKLLQSL